MDINSVTILIIDGIRQRFNAMADAFRGLEGVRVFTFGNGRFACLDKLGDWNNCVSPTGPFTLMLIHGRDDEYKDIAPCRKRIWYGGFRGRDPKAEPGEDCIMRPIEQEQDALDSSEARELIGYALYNTQKPVCLLPEGYNEHVNDIIGLLKLLLSRNSQKYNEIYEIAARLQPVMNEEHALMENIEVLTTPDLPQQQFIRELARLRDALLRSSGIIEAHQNQSV